MLGMDKVPKSEKVVYIEAGAFGALPIHVLDNGQKVIEESDMARFIQYLEDGGEMTQQIADELRDVIEGI